ncbi:MAG: hypothetical protein H0W67_07425, partial [Gemmatimonadales bacterium]|nr:hypothetical protein [Gemmatimonadales bacterium]
MLAAVVLAALVAAALVTGCGGAGRPPPIVELSPPADTVQSRYSEISSAAWLGGDRWAVAAPNDSAVGIVDFAAGTVTPLGGRRPKPLRNPSTLFVARDTLYVGDWGLRRTTLWTPAGLLARAIPTADAVRGALPEARDDPGRFYLDLAAPPGSDGSGNRDSAAVVRVDAGFLRPDTIARLAPLDIAEVNTEAGRRFERRVFSGSDLWGVVPDGSVWVARVYEN